MTALLRPEISSLAEYRLAQRACRIKLNQNENPYDLPEEIKRLREENARLKEKQSI